MRLDSEVFGSDFSSAYVWHNSARATFTRLPGALALWVQRVAAIGRKCTNRPAERKLRRVQEQSGTPRRKAKGLANQ